MIEGSIWTSSRKQRQPVHACHLVIRKHEIKIVFAREPHGLLAALRRRDLEAVVFENERVNLSLVLSSSTTSTLFLAIPISP